VELPSLAKSFAKRFPIRVQDLEPPDSHHLAAAIGWLGLGCAGEARAELAKIFAASQKHSNVLEVRWTICAHEKQWRNALEIAAQELKFEPDESTGWLHRAYALRRVNGGGLAQAWVALLPAAEKFPAEPVIAYNLSCYACQLQQFDVARHWLNRAVAAAKKDAIKKMALDDDDLQPLWEEIKDL
jgi:predicted Zn-dependent protease